MINEFKIDKKLYLFLKAQNNNFLKYF